jgi:hypothetical protein
VPKIGLPIALVWTVCPLIFTNPIGIYINWVCKCLDNSQISWSIELIILNW